jgi:plasmid replication initiation protein
MMQLLMKENTMSLPVLLPERHPQRDFFIADIFDALPVKNDRHTMEHPFFTLSTQKDVRVVEYQHGDVSITLSPSTKYGLPTMMDKDILLYCGSLIVAELNKGVMPHKTLRFSAHDLMITTNRDTSGVAYGLIKKSFERLTGCMISTNIQTNGKKYSSGFHLLESYEVIETSRDKQRMVKVEVTLSDWFYNSLVAREVLTINRNYFRLRKTLERRLYELARKHCGNQPHWIIGLENLHHKSGSQSELRKFRFQVRQIIENDAKENHFPDYRISIDEKDNVTFMRKDAVAKEQSQATLALDDLPHISSRIIDRAREIVQEAGTGWDFYALHSEFTLSLINGFKPTKVDGAFINFIKKKVKNCP